MEYHLMRKDRPIALLSIIDNKISLLERYKDSIWIDDKWIINRVKPVRDRYSLNKLLNSMEIETVEQYVNMTYALSLTDCYWVSRYDDTTLFDEVSVYKNSLNDSAAKIAFGVDGSGNVRGMTPELQTDGSYDKCWKREDGVLKLYKASTPKFNDLTGNESYSEELVCQVEEALGIKMFIRYTCKEVDEQEDSRIYSICNNFTNSKVSYLPMKDVTRYRDKSIFEQYKLMKQCGDGRLFLQMLLLDALVLNVDRHTGNYGIIYNPDNPVQYRMAPLFDHNLALIPKVKIRGAESDELERDIVMQRPYGDNFNNFIEQGQAVINHDSTLRNDLMNIRGFRFIRTDNMTRLSDERLDFLNKLVNNQIDEILKA